MSKKLVRARTVNNPPNMDQPILNDVDDEEKTLIVSCHSDINAKITNGDVRNLEFDMFESPTPLIYTPVTPFFSIFSTTIFIICCLLMYIIENFQQKKIIYRDIEGLKNHYLTVCLKSEVTKTKLESSSENINICSLAVQAKKNINYTLFQTIKTIETNGFKFPLINFYCNNEGDPTPCGLFFTSNEISIDLSFLFSSIPILTDLLNRLIGGEEGSILVHSIKDISNGEDIEQIRLTKKDGKFTLEYKNKANFFACPFFAIFLLFKKSLYKINPEAFNSISDINSLKEYLKLVEIMTPHKLLSSSCIVLNNLCSNPEFLSNISENSEHISEHMIKNFTLIDLLSYLMGIGSLNIIDMSCKLIKLSPEDTQTLYRFIAKNMYDEDPEFYDDRYMNPETFENLLNANDFENFATILYQTTGMEEYERIIFQKNFYKVKMEELKMIYMNHLLSQLYSNCGLASSTVSPNFINVVCKKPNPKEQYKGLKFPVGIVKKPKPSSPRGGSKHIKRKTQKKRKRKTQKKRKHRKFIKSK